MTQFRGERVQLNERFNDDLSKIEAKLTEKRTSLESDRNRQLMLLFQKWQTKLVQLGIGEPAAKLNSLLQGILEEQNWERAEVAALLKSMPKRPATPTRTPKGTPTTTPTATPTTTPTKSGRQLRSSGSGA
jgi:hypothetical protein